MTPRLVGHRELDGRSHPSFRDIHKVWPEFLLHDRTVNVNWDGLYADFADFQFYLVEDDVVLAEGNTIPVAWDGSPAHAGIDWAFAEGSRNAPPTTLCAVQVMIRGEAHGRGLSALMLERMTQLAAQHGLDCLIAPVRPTLKHRYPLTPIERYLTWRREDGSLFDPWLRVHERLGAEILAPAYESMRVEAGRLLGGVDGPDVSRGRPLHRRGRPRPDAGRGRHGRLRRAERLDAAPASGARARSGIIRALQKGKRGGARP